MTASPGSPTEAPQPSSRAPWLLLIGAGVVSIGAVDAGLLAASTGFFTTGFNGSYIAGAPMLLAYFAASAVLDLAFLLGFLTIALPVGARLRAGPLATFALAGALGVGIPLTLTAAHYQLHDVLGQMVNVALLSDAAGGSAATMAVQTLEQARHLIWSIPLAAAAVIACAVVARRIERRIGNGAARFAPPRLRAVMAGFAVCAFLGALILASASPTAARLRGGLERKPTAKLLAALVRRATDVDFDGYGVASRPPDPAPFDARIHPFASDLPGNGIDENALAGDHPADFAPPLSEREDTFRGDARPDLMIVFLESFRADLIDARLDGREITPFLNRLAREGASSSRAFVHVPSTVPSRAQLLGGRLDVHPGQRTLLDDFAERGYEVAYFSGQDESFDGSDALLGLDRADVFYDARDDKSLRTSESSNSASLQISWKLLTARITSFLAAREGDRPLLVYANLVDTHFPYYHGELDPILPVDPIGRGDIRAGRARRVYRAYSNAAANVDRAVAMLVEPWRQRRGGRDMAVLVTADHGQAFYENGLLGHGQSLDHLQTRVPLILWGIGGTWPEPIGLADVRGLLHRHLGRRGDGGVPKATFVPDPARWLLQWVGRDVQRPYQIGLRNMNVTVRYDFESGRATYLGPDTNPIEPSPARRQALFERLIWSWEALQQSDAER